MKLYSNIYGIKLLSGGNNIFFYIYNFLKDCCKTFLLQNAVIYSVIDINVPHVLYKLFHLICL